MANMANKILYACHHCGTPTPGKIIGMVGKKIIREMCDACEKYIGSPAAHLPGATMNNRIQMQALYKKHGPATT